MTPVMCHSQPTQCAYIGLTRAPPPPRPPAQRYGAVAPVQTRRRCGRRLIACGPDLTVRRCASRRPLESDATPPSGSSSRAERGSFTFVPALAGDEPAAGADSGTCCRTQTFGPRTDRYGHKTHVGRSPASPATPNTRASSTRIRKTGRITKPKSHRDQNIIGAERNESRQAGGREHRDRDEKSTPNRGSSDSGNQGAKLHAPILDRGHGNL